MKLFKKLSIFVVVVIMLFSVFVVSAYAEDETAVKLNENGYKLDVHCPNCKEIGLVYNGEYFECPNKDHADKKESCGYMYTIECSFCKGNNFSTLENGLYVCNGTDEVECGKIFTATNIEAMLVLSKKPSGGKLDMGMKPEGFGERAKVALQGTVTGMVMVFAVLGLLAVIMTLSKVIFYDIPNKKREAKKAPKTVAAAPASTASPAPTETPAAVSEEADDGELAAVITAAIAAMLDSEEYKNEFVGGFRVVSFKRTTSGAWNRK